MSIIVADLVKELPKSNLPAGSAVDGGEFIFFVSGPKPLLCDVAIQDGEALVLSTGGNAAVHIGRKQFSYSTDCWALEPIASKVSGEFLYQYISFKINHIDTFGFEGSGLRHLKKEFLRKYPVPEFTRPEQTKIAEVLSTVDQAIEQTEALIAKQQRIKTGLMQDLLTRGIDEHGNLRSEQTHEFKDSLLGRIPVEWEVKSLEKCVRNDSPICYGILMPGSSHHNGVPVIKVKDVIGGKILQNNLLLTDPKIDSQYKRTRHREGDLLITIRGTTGRVALVPSELDKANITQDTARVRLMEEYSILFFYFLLQSKYVQDQVLLHTLGQAVKGINIAEVKKISFGLPKQHEQQTIAERLNKLEWSLGCTERELKKLRSLKTALMQDLLTGKKRVAALLNDTEE
ncbi:MAG: restriction endonuclease subunit S [Erysipelotrichaceae bacterium]|nr:restriction endonuclease subunit S [Erysipelotrichaceae bacterium]